jgi:hypothetical protein
MTPTPTVTTSPSACTAGRRASGRRDQGRARPKDCSARHRTGGGRQRQRTQKGAGDAGVRGTDGGFERSVSEWWSRRPRSLPLVGRSTPKLWDCHPALVAQWIEHLTTE